VSKSLGNKAVKLRQAQLLGCRETRGALWKGFNLA